MKEILGADLKQKRDIDGGYGDVDGDGVVSSGGPAVMVVFQRWLWRRGMVVAERERERERMVLVLSVCS